MECLTDVKSIGVFIALLVLCSVLMRLYDKTESWAARIDVLPHDTLDYRGFACPIQPSTSISDSLIECFKFV